MAGRVYTAGMHDLIAGNKVPGTDIIKSILIMTGSTVLTDDPTTVGGFTTLSECDDTTYARQSLATVALAEDTGNRLDKVTADDPTFANTGDATLAIAGIMHVWDDVTPANMIPICYQPYSSNQTLDGTNHVPQLPGSVSGSGGRVMRFLAAAGS